MLCAHDRLVSRIHPKTVFLDEIFFVLQVRTCQLSFENGKVLPYVDHVSPKIRIHGTAMSFIKVQFQFMYAI